ncbi:sensor histidine kinase [Pseudobacter ginsenosidimutans]|uniref:histidine kinase n=1 Tax=Pseudobacter ginsenosidimutans TaxID=661488 RepID=A0A4Q7MR59_9BACT|nr:ATP-binding protein [Pseudobacter ginsenosidimutans]QEC41931.1 sensor histidine kinase [Pseudobacter ginsenosidimutans]RZS71242.1 two-component system phosphate regulon sensor histidine kinase PhoR [Pseudobacter ginsenosidimutans]
MLSTKNLSPRQLAAYTAGILSIPIAIGIAVLTMNWKIGVVSLGVVFAGSYSLIIITLERFIYRKIKLIYKLIYQTKATKKEEVYFKYILPQKSIDEVREDVEEWGERRNREIESLRQNEAFRKEFLQNLSHEFKTPIFAIQSFVETLLDGAADDEKVRTKFLQNTSKNVDRLVNLVNDLDEISRLESGAQLLYKQNFIIQDLIRETYDSLSIKTQAKQIKTSIKKGCEAPVTVFADKEKIKQVLTNLVENACKYGKNGGTIVASVYKTDDSHVLIEIGDDGIGIEEEHLHRIFERFYRTDTARSRDKGGTGLGLAICKHIIEAHGQSIHVRSTPDVGTTIGFTLEAKREV